MKVLNILNRGISLILVSLGMFALTSNVLAQCSNCNANYPSGTQSTTSTGLTTVSTCVYGGEYSYYSVTAGETYSWTTCGDTDFDTQLTLFNGVGCGGGSVAYNDDDCGLQSTITWTATTTGTVTLLLSSYPCTNQSTCMTVQWACTSCGGGGGGGTNNEYCDQMQPICTGSGLNFTANDGGISAGTLDPGNNYDCLITQPNPTWYYFEIAQAGPINMSLSAPSDIDFIIYGPYSSLTQAENDCGNMGSPAGEIVDCSFSATNNETPSIPNAQVGQVYVMLITNYASVVQNITLNQTSGTGATDCGIVYPCNIDYFEANISACDPGTNTFSVSGQVDFVSAPTTGQLIVEDCNGNQQVFNAPFTSPTLYNITGITADGAACDVTAYFTADPTCTQTIAYTNPVACTPNCFINYMSVNIGACDPSDNNFDLTGELQFTDAPTTGQLIFEDCNGNQQVFNAPFTSPTFYTIADVPSDGTLNCSVNAYFTADPSCTMTSPLYDNPTGCQCSADAGTFSQGTVGNTNSTGPYDLCFGDELDITANADYTAPDDYTGVIAAVYDPGMWLLVYSCPPTVGPPDDINNDPCLLGVASTADQAWTIINNIGDGSTLYFVPVTMYSMTDGIYAISINGGDWCYDLGPTYQVNFLEDIVANPTQDCTAGTVTVSVSGGLPAFSGGQFTGSNLSPGTANFVTGTTSNGGNIVVGGLQDGDNYSFDITDANGCPVTITGTFIGLEDPSFTYPQTAYCQNEPNPSPTITGVTGGTFTAPAGVSINAATGVINLAASTSGGPYTITYQTPDPLCFDVATFDITINPQPIVDGNDPVVCLGQQVTLNGTGADSYSWTGGVTNGVPFTPPLGTTSYTVTGTITATGCSNTGSSTVTVNPLDDASFTTTNFCAGSASPVATVTGTPGGTFTFDPMPGNGETINSLTGSISGGIGGTTYTIQYTTSGACPATSTQTVTVYALPVVDVPDYSVCTGGTIPLTATGANTYSWSPSTYLSGTTGATVNSTPAANITYTVTGTDINGCVGTDLGTVSVIPNAPINAGPDVAICAGESTTLTASGGVSYTWATPISAGGAIQSVTPSSTTTYTVDGLDAQGCAGTDQVTVTVNPLPVVNAGSDQVVCENTAVTLAGSGATNYTWTNGVMDNLAFTPGVGTVIYTVTGTDVNGCVDTDQVNVTVNPLPVVGAGLDQIVCENTVVTLSGTGASNYTWDNGVINNTPFTPGVGTVIYTVTGTDANSCVGTDQVTVTVNPLPLVNAGPDQIVCDGEAVTLSGSGAVGYIWNNGVTDNVPFTPSVGTVTYTVTGTDANSCVNTDQVTVTVNPNPTPVINGATDYCMGSFSTLSTTVPYTTYLWSTNATTASVNVTAGTYTVEVTNSFGCSGTSPSFTVIENTVITYNSSVTICQGESALIHGNTETVAGVYSQTFILPTGCDSTSNVTLVVNPLPAVDAGADQILCNNGTQIVLTATGANNYTWDNGVVQSTPFTQSVGTVTYMVTGTDANGCVNTDQVDVTVNPLPVVGAGPDQTLCAGSAVTLSGTGAVSYSWNNGVTDNTAFTPSVGAVIYTVTGTDANGCVNTDQVSVTINPLPVVDAGPDQTVCEGEQVTLTAQGATSYSWDNGVVQGTPFTPSVGTVTYTVTGTDANGCVNTDQVDVTANPLPVVDAGADLMLCDGDQATLSASGAMNYLWDNGAVQGSTFTPAVGTVTYTVIGTDANGCEDTDQLTVTVNPLPNVEAGPDQVVCVGEQVILNASGATSYSWTNGVVQGTPFTPSVGTTTYTVTGTDANGCENTDQLSVTANPLPVVFAGNDFVSCEGDMVVLTGSGAQSYTWDNGVTNGVAFTPSGTQTYTVTGTDANGCQNTDQVTVTVEPLPLVSFTADVTSGCAPLEVVFTNTTSGNLTDCIWTFSNGTTVSGCNNVTVTFPNGGLYDVTLTTTSSNGCTNSETYDDYIYVEDEPIAAFTPSSSVVSVLNPVVHFDNNSTGATNYLWDFGDGSATTTQENPVHNFPDTGQGSYVVELIAYSSLGCSDTAYVLIVVNEELIFYVPNSFTPDGDDYNELFRAIFTSGYDPFDFTLLIFDRWGEIVWESHDDSVGWDGTYGEEGRIVQDGTYTWKIEFKTTMTDERVMAVGHVNVLR